MRQGSLEGQCWSLTPRESLVLGAEQNGSTAAALRAHLLARTTHTERLSVPIRRRNTYQSMLKPIFYWRYNIYLFFIKEKKKLEKATFTKWNEGQMESNNP